MPDTPNGILGFFAGVAKEALDRGVNTLGREASGYIHDRATDTVKRGARNIAGLPSSGGPDSAVGPDGLPMWLSREISRPFGSVLVLGERGEGKTAFCLEVAELRGKDTYWLVDERRGFPNQLKGRVLPVNGVADADNIPPGSTFIIDDASRHFNARTFMSPDNLEFMEIQNTVRHRELFMLMNVQTAAMVDRFGIEATLFAQKWPNPRVMGMERPILADMVERAIKGYKSLGVAGEDSRKEWIYIEKDPDHHTMVQYSPPAWYGSEQSRFNTGRGSNQTSEPGPGPAEESGNWWGP